jgi:hypothetical protein
MIDRLIEIGRRHGMEINVEKTKAENLKAAIPNKIYDRSKQLDNVEFLIIWVEC